MKDTLVINMINNVTQRELVFYQIFSHMFYLINIKKRILKNLSSHKKRTYIFYVLINNGWKM